MFSSQDKSNGYEEIAEHFMRARNPGIGPATVKEWSKTLPARSSILDVGCGSGVPISQTLIDEGFTLYGVDASPTLIAAFRTRFPRAVAECCAAEESEFFGRKFDGVIAWGLIFLLRPELQSAVIRRIAAALKPGGRFLFTSPKDAITWRDSLTDHESVSLGADRYHEILGEAGLEILGHQTDEGDNYYYEVISP